MRYLAALATLALAVTTTAFPAAARSSFVQDDGKLFTAGAVSIANQKIGDFNTQTGKEVFVYTTNSIEGTPQAAAERVFAQNQVNGVLIFVAKSPKTVGVIPDRTAKRYFPSGSTKSIQDAIRANFKSGDFDGGLQSGVDLSLNMYRSHLGSLGRRGAEQRAPVSTSQSTGGFSMSWIWIILILVVGFLIVRSIFRAMAPRQQYGPPPGGPGYGQPGYGQPGYGGGMGGGMGGGGFFSGLLGGLGGAFLGNQLFGHHDGGNVTGAGFGGEGGAGNGGDGSGFQSDAGQADMGNASFGDYGGGGGDSGGGWGGDSGGGGGDSGGGW